MTKAPERRRLAGFLAQPGLALGCMVYRANRLAPVAMHLTDLCRALGPGLRAVMDEFWAAHPHAQANPLLECARFCGVCGKDDEETLDLFIDKIEELKAKVGIKKSIAEYGISEETFMSTLDQMVEDAFDDQCTGANPRYPLLKEIKAMYLKAYYGEKA